MSNEESFAKGSLTETLLYGLSLPERTIRSASAIAGGLVGETAARLIPVAFRSSRSYSVFVQQALDMLVHDVGGVSRAESADPALAAQESNLARKAVGGMLDIAGAATLHLSPMTVLAVFSDMAYGSSHYLKLLSEELKREGIIDQASSIDGVSDLVSALNSASAKAAETMDAPPVSLPGIRETIEQLRAEISKVDPTRMIPQAEIGRLWDEMETAARDADVGLWDVSTTMTMFAMNRLSLTTRGTLSTIRVAGNLFDQHIIGHYADALDEIGNQGLYPTLSRAASPYLAAVWHNFDGTRPTWTEDLVSGRMLSTAWRGVRGWWDGNSAAPPPESQSSPDSEGP